MSDDSISRQAAINTVSNWLRAVFGVNSNANTIGVFRELRALPSAEPVIRCKDCKHYQFADNRAFGMPVKMCEWFGFEDVDDYDFCSRAERKQDAIS